MYINMREELLPDTFREPAAQISSSCYSKVDEEPPRSSGGAAHQFFFQCTTLVSHYNPLRCLRRFGNLCVLGALSSCSISDRSLRLRLHVEELVVATRIEYHDGHGFFQHEIAPSVAQILDDCRHGCPKSILKLVRVSMSLFQQLFQENQLIK